MQAIDLDLPRTALVLIDLQRSAVARTLAPHTSQQVVDNSARLAQAVRAQGGTIVHVRVLVNDILRLPVDRSVGRDPSAPPLSASDLELVGVEIDSRDVLIDKRQWGAFHGTALDQQLRRRGIDTIILAGIATNFGVESTARAAFDIGYKLVFAHDAMSTLNEELHRFATQVIFPVIGRVRSTEALLRALGADGRPSGSEAA